jgi:class 3 adenylate cyclase
MSKENDDLYKKLFGPPEEPAADSLNNLRDLLGRAMNSPPPASSASMPENFFRALSDLSRPAPKPPSSILQKYLGHPIVESPLFGLEHIARPSPPTSAANTAPPAAPLGLDGIRRMVGALLRRKATVTAGRVLPGIEDLAVMEGRRVRAAFVYSDLHGFTKLVATQPETKSFVFLDTFVNIASRLTSHYGGQVMDCAGDRVLSVFHRSPGNLSNEPVEDGITFALWLQTVFNSVVAPAFAAGGLAQLSLGIGVDYGEAVVGCVGIRNNKRIVFFGDAANNAAKLQDGAGPSETIVSQEADARRPVYLDNGTWNLRRETLANGQTILRIMNCCAADTPPRPR